MPGNDGTIDRMSKSAGLHYYESWTHEPEPRWVPIGPQLEHELPPVLPPPIQGQQMPLLDSFQRHVDDFFVNHHYGLLLTQVRHRF